MGCCGRMEQVVDDTVVFSASFQIIKEASTFAKLQAPSTSTSGGGGGGGRNGGGGGGKSRRDREGGRDYGGPERALGGSDLYNGKFSWRIENFTKLKELLKKRKITGLCIKSRRFQVRGTEVWSNMNGATRDPSELRESTPTAPHRRSAELDQKQTPTPHPGLLAVRGGMRTDAHRWAGATAV